MKNSILLVAILFLIACHSDKNKNQSDQKQEAISIPIEAPVGDSQSNRLDIFYENDDYETLIKELDSLGLKYDTVTSSEEAARYREPDWQHIEYEPDREFSISKSDTIEFEDLRFEIEYNDKMNFNDNANAFYGGIQTMKVFYKNKHTQTLKNIEDGIALGTVYFYFFDYNMDGYPDIKIPLNDNYPSYFIFNPKTKQFQYAEDWDYVRVLQLNTKEKQIITTPDGNPDYGFYYRYQIKGNKLKKLKKFYYHTMKEKRELFTTTVHLDN